MNRIESRNNKQVVKNTSLILVLEPNKERLHTRKESIEAFEHAVQTYNNENARAVELGVATMYLHHYLVPTLQPENFLSYVGAPDKHDSCIQIRQEGRNRAVSNGITYDDKYDPFKPLPIEACENVHVAAEGELRSSLTLGKYSVGTGQIAVKEDVYEASQEITPLPSPEYPGVLIHEGRHKADWEKTIKPFCAKKV